MQFVVSAAGIALHVEHPVVIRDELVQVGVRGLRAILQQQEQLEPIQAGSVGKVSGLGGIAVHAPGQLIRVDRVAKQDVRPVAAVDLVVADRSQFGSRAAADQGRFQIRRIGHDLGLADAARRVCPDIVDVDVEAGARAVVVHRELEAVLAGTVDAGSGVGLAALFNDLPFRTDLHQQAPLEGIARVLVAQRRRERERGARGGRHDHLLRFRHRHGVGGAVRRVRIGDAQPVVRGPEVANVNP
ncbi:hypothetical protein D3C86_1004830 [compost metagenome]